MQCLPWSGPEWTQHLYIPGQGKGGCPLGFVTLLCHGSHLPFDWLSPLAFWNLAMRTAWELSGWAEALFPTKHSAAMCRLSSVLCLILFRLLKTPVTAVIHPFPWPLPCAPKPLIPLCTHLVCVEPHQLTGSCILVQFLGAGPAASVHANKSHLLDLFTFNLVCFCAVQTALLWGVFWHFSSSSSLVHFCSKAGLLLCSEPPQVGNLSLQHPLTGMINFDSSW